jgi:tetratricopeptide (TPR) repeat protein
MTMSGNDDYGVVREEVLADAQERARALAADGLPAHEIEHRLDRDLTATERELLWGIAKHAVAAARANPQERRELGGPPMPALSRPSPAAPVVLALRERWQKARQWARARLDRGSVRAVVAVALAGAMAGVLIGVLIGGSRHHGAVSSPRAQSERADRSRTTSRPQTPGPIRSRSSPPPSRGTPAAPPPAPAGPRQPESQTPPAVSADAAGLNDRGYQLMSKGRYQDAIPLLRRAVSSAGNGGDLTYAYALYNLGRSLRLAGKPGEAIPLLERRLRIDNQRATVARELEAARRSAHDTGGAR